jgi:hypothetical protein
MRLKIRPEDVSAHEMSDWLAWLRAEMINEAGDNETEPETVAPAPPPERPPARVNAPARVTTPARVKTPASGGDTCRAVIGDELRMPTAWCEMGSCISYYTDPMAFGEADIRVRALGAGWRFDRFGQLVCVDCQRSNPWYRTCYPVVLWDRQAAVATATMMATRPGHESGHGGTAAAPSALTPTVDPLVSPPVGQGTGGRHRKQQ